MKHQDMKIKPPLIKELVSLVTLFDKKLNL